MPDTPEHPSAPDRAGHVSRVRAQIGAAAAATSDLLDLLTAGLAEDDEHTPDDPASEAHDRSLRDDEGAGDGCSREGGGSR